MNRSEKLFLGGGVLAGLALWALTRPTTVAVRVGTLAQTLPRNVHGYVFDTGDVAITFMSIVRTAPGGATATAGWSGPESQTVGYVPGAVVTITTNAGVAIYTMASA